PRRERLAWRCLGLAGYEIYEPLLRERRRRRDRHRRVIGMRPLVPGSLCGGVVLGWGHPRWSRGGVGLFVVGLLAARVPDAVITESRARERGGFGQLPKVNGLKPGMRVKVLQGPLQDHIGLLAALRPHERVLVLLQLLGGQQRVELARSSVEVG